MFDLWALYPGSRIVETDDEALVRRIASEMLDLGSKPDDLSLGLPDGRVLEGEALTAWIENQ